VNDTRPGGHWRLVPADEGGDVSGPGVVPFTADAKQGQAEGSATIGGPGSNQMEDKDVQRLEDRIAASEERGQLRLELAMTRIDGKLDAIVQSIQEVSRFSSAQATESAARYHELRDTVSTQAAESVARFRDLQTTVSAQATESAARHRDLQSSVSAQAAESGARHRDLQSSVSAQAAESSARYRELQKESSARYRELRNTIIVTGVAVVFGIAATLIGLKQVWVGGVEVGLPLGQAIQMQAATGSAPAASSAAAPSGQPTAPAAPSRQSPPTASPAPTGAKPNG